MIENSAENNKLTTADNGLVYLHNLIYVPKSMRNEIISIHHDTPLHGHTGMEKTSEQIARNYYFPNIRKAVQEYVKNCEVSIRDKAARHQPYGKMQSPHAPVHPWEWVTIDFITQLPMSRGYDSITVITDRLTKYIHLVPAKGNMTATDMAQLFLKHVIVNHGMPQKITSDRDKLFTSKFWTTLTNLMGIDHRLITAYHSQTNGQTERTNQTIEQYLRHYINYEQDDWIKFLPMAQFAFNDAEHSTTKVTPFYANYGYHPALHKEPRPHESTSEQAEETVKKLKNLYTQLSKDIDFMNSPLQ